MKNHIIEQITNKMASILDAKQMKKLQDVLADCLGDVFPEAEAAIQQNIVQTFLAAKRVEGCSEKTARYYDSTIRNVLTAINKQD